MTLSLRFSLGHRLKRTIPVNIAVVHAVDVAHLLPSKDPANQYCGSGYVKIRSFGSDPNPDPEPKYICKKEPLNLAKTMFFETITYLSHFL